MTISKTSSELSVEICLATLEMDSNKKITATQLRGFLGYLFAYDSEFHHHSESSFHYPLVQYKIIDNKPVIMGIKQYSKIVFNRISQLEHIILPYEKIRILNITIEKKKVDIQFEQLRKYKFITPWIALNGSNYSKFKKLDNKNSRTYFLEKILIGNILSALKGLEIYIDFPIATSIKNIRSVPITVHSNNFQSFLVEFTLNLILPRYLGIGKSVSKGYGTIENLNK